MILEEKPARGWVAPIRRKTKTIAVHVSPATRQQLDEIMAKRDSGARSYQEVLMEALDLWFAEEGAHRIARSGWLELKGASS